MERQPGPITLVECPRDAMQGWPHFIPTAQKVAYLNALLDVGFDVLDFGSFVSPKAIPQMADTAEVLPQLRLNDRTKLLAIIANQRGAEQAAAYDEITYLGFPFSISETFQLRNTNKTIEQSLHEVEAMQSLCANRGKQLVVYISMGFGNPYGDAYSPDVAIEWVGRLAQLGVQTFAMSDTVGVAEPGVIGEIFSALIPQFPDCVIGSHFHSTPSTRREKLEAAWAAGCRRFDSAIGGIGGCPMAKDELVGNMATEEVINCFEQSIRINQQAFDNARAIAQRIFI